MHRGVRGLGLSHCHGGGGHADPRQRAEAGVLGDLPRPSGVLSKQRDVPREQGELQLVGCGSKLNHQKAADFSRFRFKPFWVPICDPQPFGTRKMGSSCRPLLAFND